MALWFLTASIYVAVSRGYLPGGAVVAEAISVFAFINVAPAMLLFTILDKREHRRLRTKV